MPVPAAGADAAGLAAAGALAAGLAAVAAAALGVAAALARAAVASGFNFLLAVAGPGAAAAAAGRFFPAEAAGTCHTNNQDPETGKAMPGPTVICILAMSLCIEWLMQRHANSRCRMMRPRSILTVFSYHEHNRVNSRQSVNGRSGPSRLITVAVCDWEASTRLHSLSRQGCIAQHGKAGPNAGYEMPGLHQAQAASRPPAKTSYSLKF